MAGEEMKRDSQYEAVNPMPPLLRSALGLESEALPLSQVSGRELQGFLGVCSMSRVGLDATTQPATCPLPLCLCGSTHRLAEIWPARLARVIQVARKPHVARPGHDA